MTVPFRGIAGVSRLGLGCATAWGQPWFDERTAIRILHRALELGIRTLDTGPSYSGGNAEPRLGRALRGTDLSGLEVSTKVGTHRGRFGRLYHDLGREAVLRSVENSRRNLGIDRIPLLYLHGPWPGELDARLADLMGELLGRGWVGRVGVNSYDLRVIEQAMDWPVFTDFMLDYHLLRLDREPLIERLHAAGRRVVAGSALGNQLHAPQFLRPRGLQDVWYLLRLLSRYRNDWRNARRLRFLQQVPGWTPAQIALALVLDNPRVEVAMFGTTRLAHLEENVAAAGRELPAPLVRQIRECMGV
jgi:1-deoxyxylulose-5-phosphate synthase